MTQISPRRVAITGLGLVSPVGNTTEALHQALTQGISGVRALETLPARLLNLPWAAPARHFTGHIEDFGPLEKNQKRLIRKNIKVMCREIQMGVAAAQRALCDAGLKAGDCEPERTGVLFGCDYILSGPDEFVNAMLHCRDAEKRFDYDQWGQRGIPRITPLWLLKFLPNMPASHIAIYNDLRGPNNSLTMREVSANAAIGEASQLIARGSADKMIAGATGTRVHPLRTLHVVLQEEVATGDGDPAKACKPFDKNRRGMVLGEGAGAVMLESFESAEARGAKILGEIAGAGSSAVIDARGVGDLKQATFVAMRQALQHGGLEPNAIGHVHAHGASTQYADAAEAQAIAQLFDSRTKPVPVMAVKSYLGNAGAACGVIELIASILAMEHGHLFPVLNYQTPDPDCPVQVVAASDMPAGDSFLNLNVTPVGQATAVAVTSGRAA
ncbi:MAG: beta-ketoacyl-[acyl-carrier-protein] synthase family protein [Planctomycetota bacterium]